MHLKDSYTNVSNSPSTLLLRRGDSALFWALTFKTRYLSSNVEPFKSWLASSLPGFNGEHPFLSPCSWFCTHSHTSWWGRPLSRWPLCWPLTNALPLCVGGPLWHQQSMLTSFYTFFFFLNKKSLIVSVPQVNESMNSFEIPLPLIYCYILTDL